MDVVQGGVDGVLGRGCRVTVVTPTPAQVTVATPTPAQVAVATPTPHPYTSPLHLTQSPAVLLCNERVFHAMQLLTSLLYMFWACLTARSTRLN